MSVNFKKILQSLGHNSESHFNKIHIPNHKVIVIFAMKIVSCIVTWSSNLSILHENSTCLTFSIDIL